MTGRAVLVLSGALALLGLGLTTSSATRAGAQDAAPVTVVVDQVGWWTDRPAAAPTAEGGFEVATDGAGEPQSVAAAQLTLVATSVEKMEITLTESSALADFGSIAVCRTHSSWTPENPGSLSDAPTADCSTRVELTRSAGGGSWLGDITPLVRDGGTVSLVFVPRYRPPTPIAPGMLVRISELSAEGTGGFSADTGSGPVSTTSTSTTSAPPPASAAPPPASTESPGTGATRPDIGRPDPLGSNLAAGPPPTTVPISDRTAAAEDGFFTLGPVEQQAADSRPWGRLVILVPLAAALGVGSVRLRRLFEQRRSLAGSV